MRVPSTKDLFLPVWLYNGLFIRWMWIGRGSIQIVFMHGGEALQNIHQAGACPSVSVCRRSRAVTWIDPYSKLTMNCDVIARDGTCMHTDCTNIYWAERDRCLFIIFALIYFFFHVLWVSDQRAWRHLPVNLPRLTQWISHRFAHVRENGPRM